VLALEAPGTAEIEMWQHAIEKRLNDVQHRKEKELKEVEEILTANGKKSMKDISPEQRLQHLQEAISDTSILHEGWLTKVSGGKSGHSIGNVRNHEDLRYCILSPLYLRYYETMEDHEMDNKPKGVINLVGAGIEHRYKPGKQFKPKFKLVLPSHNGQTRNMPLIASDKEDMDMWVVMFETAIARAEAKHKMKSSGDYGTNIIARNLSLITHEGMMLKKSKKRTNQKRWFSIRDGVLYYYGDQGDNEPINWIQPDADTKLKCDDTDDNRFNMITGSGRKFTLATIMEDDGKSREEWVQALYAIVKVRRCLAVSKRPRWQS
jgi:hypothetical protein